MITIFLAGERKTLRNPAAMMMMIMAKRKMIVVIVIVTMTSDDSNYRVPTNVMPTEAIQTSNIRVLFSLQHCIVMCVLNNSVFWKW